MDTADITVQRFQGILRDYGHRLELSFLPRSAKPREVARKDALGGFYFDRDYAASNIKNTDRGHWESWLSC